MTDTVTVTKLFDGIHTCEYEFTNQSDGTGETEVKKIDLTDLVGSTGALTGGDRPSSLSLLKVEYETTFTLVKMLWDRSPTNEVAAVMVGHGEICHKSGKHDPKRGQDGTGDILITTVGTVRDMTYTIRAKFRKKY